MLLCGVVLRCWLLWWLLLLLLLLLLVGAAVGLGRCDEKKRGRETRAGGQAGQAGKAAGAGNRQTGWKSGDPQDPVGMVMVLYVCGEEK